MNIQARYDTADVAPSERFAFWREAVCDSYVQLGCDVEDRTGFHGVIEIARHSVLSISKVSGKSHKVERRRRDIRAATDPYFLLSLQMNESSGVTQFGKTAMLQPGDMALYSSTDPYQLHLNDQFSQMVVQVPAEKLLSRLPNAEALTACRIDGQSGIGALVRQNIIAFSSHAGSANPTVQTLVQDTLIDLIATGLATGKDAALELSSPEQHVMLRARSFIRANLGNPELDRNMVASEMGMSVRRLNAIFAKDGETLSGLIREMRLDAVSQDLRDARFAAQSISEIAFRHGFSNMQNFSTLFRSHFGQTPRSFRA